MENKYVMRAKAFRAETSAHYNCAQAVLASFAEECGISEEKAIQMGAHFGHGMNMGATCGAMTGALMVIGMLGGGREQSHDFMTAMRQHHTNLTDCKDLLRVNAEKGGSRQEHCDNMVYEAVEEVTKIMGLE